MNEHMPKARYATDYLTIGTGKKLNIANPEPELMDIEIIAHALSMQCRFAGHVKEFYSVAQHSVYVSYLVPREDALAGLLHDAAEAFVTDIPKPIKVLIPEFDVIESHFWRAITERYDLDFELPTTVHLADQQIVMAEARDLLPGDNWKSWYPGVEASNIYVVGMSPAEAYKTFMTRYSELTHWRNSNA